MLLKGFGVHDFWIESLEDAQNNKKYPEEISFIPFQKMKFFFLFALL